MGSLKKVKLDIPLLDEYTVLNSTEIIRFIFDDADPVTPEFVHQNFGQSGEIVWPTDLLPLTIKIHVLTSEGMRADIHIEHGGEWQSDRAKMAREEVLGRIMTPCELEGGCKRAVYPIECDQQDLHTDDNHLKPSYECVLADGFVVERYSSKDFKSKSFAAWKRAEWLMLWFIESVSQSEHETDPRWDYFFLKDPKGRIVSLCSVYIFPSFAFLSKGFIGDRLRLSQFLTIPSSWKHGIGSKLLRHIVDDVNSRGDVDKFTMEDPSFGMTSLRESVYLRVANEANLFNVKNVSLLELEKALKIPRVFAKRIKNLFELNHIRGSRKLNDSLVDRLMASDNRYIQKFIDSIEFYDDEEVDGAIDRPISEEKTRLLVRTRMLDALQKLEKIKA